MIQLKRAYEPAAKGDGARFLVERLWPRGIKKENLPLAAWLKDVAPSNTLRRRFHGNPAMWDQFVTAYARELAQEPALGAAAKLRALARKQSITLLYAARDENHNNAVALKKLLRSEKPSTETATQST